MADDNKLSPAEIVIVASGAVALLGSFLPWVEFGPFDANAWDDGLFPTYTWPALSGVVMAGIVLVTTFSSVSVRQSVAGFTWGQIHLVLAGLAGLMSVSFLMAGDEFGIGFWLTLLASIGLVVGAVMLQRELVGPATT